MKLIFLLCVGLVMGGCATAYDVDLYKAYSEAEQNGQDNSWDVVDSQAAAIKALGACPNCTETEQVLLKVIMSRDIASIQAPQFHVKAPTLNTDNAGKALDTVGGGIPWLTIGYTNKVNSEQQKGSNLTAGGDIKLDGSLNANQNHANTVGDNSPSTLTTKNDKIVPDSAVDEEPELILDYDKLNN